MPAPKEQPPRKLSGKRTARLVSISKETPAGFGPDASADGIILSGTATDGASTGFWGIIPRNLEGPSDACARQPLPAETYPFARTACRLRGQDGAVRRLRHAGSIRHRCAEGTP